MKRMNFISGLQSTDSKLKLPEATRDKTDKSQRVNWKALRTALKNECFFFASSLIGMAAACESIVIDGAEEKM